MMQNKITSGSLTAIMSPWSGLGRYFFIKLPAINIDYDSRILGAVFIGFSSILRETGLCESTLGCVQPSSIVGLKKG